MAEVKTRTYLEVDCFKVDIEKLYTVFNITREMSHKRLEAAEDILEELIRNLTIESRDKWEEYKKQENPSYWEER